MCGITGVWRTRVFLTISVQECGCFSSHHLWIGTDFLHPSQWTEVNEPFWQGEIKTKGAHSNAFRGQAGRGSDWSRLAGGKRGGKSHRLLDGMMWLSSRWSSRRGNAGLGLPDIMPFQEKPEIQVVKCHGFYALAIASHIGNPSVWVNQNRSADGPRSTGTTWHLRMKR